MKIDRFEFGPAWREFAAQVEATAQALERIERQRRLNSYLVASLEIARHKESAHD